jgi:hypothetical protein
MKNWLKDKRSFILFSCCFGFFRQVMTGWYPILWARKVEGVE